VSGEAGYTNPIRLGWTVCCASTSDAEARIAKPTRVMEAMELILIPHSSSTIKTKKAKTKHGNRYVYCRSRQVPRQDWDSCVGRHAFTCRIVADS
jgi:hypothetical protein